MRRRLVACAVANVVLAVGCRAISTSQQPVDTRGQEATAVVVGGSTAYCSTEFTATCAKAPEVVVAAELERRLQQDRRVRLRWPASDPLAMWDGKPETACQI